jgi:selenocysteine lyase/cysteine desulfurase
VLDAVNHYETHLHSNVHRGVHTLSHLATDALRPRANACAAS